MHVYLFIRLCFIYPKDFQILSKTNFSEVHINTLLKIDLWIFFYKIFSMAEMSSRQLH